MYHPPGQNPRNEQPAPPYSQFDALPHAQQAQYVTYSTDQPQQSMSRLGMSSMGHALPETFTSSTPTRGFPQLALPYGSGGLPLGVEYRPQALSSGLQGYLPNVAMHASMPPIPTHASLFASNYYYNSYGASQPSGQPLTGYATKHIFSHPHSGTSLRSPGKEAAFDLLQFRPDSTTPNLLTWLRRSR